jgi:hypothetical protein
MTGGTGTIGKQSNRLLPFKIHDNSPIALAALPGPLVNANDLRINDGREGKGMHEAQNRAFGGLHPQEFGGACPHCSALFLAKLTEKLTQTERVTTMGRGHLGKSLRENAPRTARVITVELADVQMQDDLHVLNRQIPDRAFIAAMDTTSGSCTHGTRGGPRYSLTDEHQTAGLPLLGEKAETAEMWKEGMLRQGNVLSERIGEETVTLLFYHISNLHQTGRRT